MKKKNPYLLSYLSLTIICCIVLGVFFGGLNHTKMKNVQRDYYQKRIELFAKDLENQMQLFKEIALKIKINKKYHLYNLNKGQANIINMLEDFEQYSQYSILTEECFLYYGGNKVYCSNGFTADLDVYMEELTEEEKKQLMGVMNEPSKNMYVLSAARKLYIMNQFSVIESMGKTNVTLCFVINHDEIEKRFQVITGGMKGKIFLYASDKLLYSNREAACTAEEKDVLSVTFMNGDYTICFLPDGDDLIQGKVMLSQIILILVEMLFLIWIANLFAKKSYQPILDLSDKWRQNVDISDEKKCENALEEINYMMENILQSNMLFNIQISKKKEILHRQVLQILLSGNYFFEIQDYLEKLQIDLPGPYYFVICLSFEEKEDITNEVLKQLQKELEQITDEGEMNYVYVVCDYKKKQLSIICSITDMIHKEELTEYVCEVAGSHGHKVVVGVGNIYQNLSRVSASWLESVDNMHKKSVSQGTLAEEGILQESDELLRISSALSKGDEEKAMASFVRYMESFGEGQTSILMQKYIAADFLSEISKIAKEKNINLSNQSISLIMSAQSIEGLKEASCEIIHSFCAGVKQMEKETEKKESYKIYEYITLHFAEYDMSIEKVAEVFQTTTAMVRQAVVEHTGKMYKDYIISLRVEYAKKLLLKEGMTVADTCRQVGYGNISYFIKMFKGVTGVTPAKYKEMEESDYE